MAKGSGCAAAPGHSFYLGFISPSTVTALKLADGAFFPEAIVIFANGWWGHQHFSRKAKTEG